MKNQVISPIAIDLGAKHTGVFFAHYPTGSSLEKVGQSSSGKVYTLPNDKFTYLMRDRTARRHQKRSLDRRQMAKRLFKLVWEKHLELPWGDEIQEAISFLLNRRGFTRLDETYDRDALHDMPPHARQHLIDVLDLNDGDDERAADVILDNLIFDGLEAVKAAHKDISKKTKPYRNAKDYHDLTHKLGQYCLEKTADTTRRQARNRLQRVSEGVCKRWAEAGIVKGLPQPAQGKNFFNVADWLDDDLDTRKEATLKAIKEPDWLQAAKAEIAEVEKEAWGFAPHAFDLEKFHNRPELEAENDETEIRWHLHHFAFALHAAKNEMESGGRSRNRYFDEIGSVLNESGNNEDQANKSDTTSQGKAADDNQDKGEMSDTKISNAISTFCSKLRNEEYKLPDGNPMDAEMLTHLIGHISNLELKPLRKYFKDPAHKSKSKDRSKDYWNEARLKKIVDDWMFKEWRVGKQDRMKADNAQYSYKELKQRWNKKSGGVIDFWLGEDPNFTIPPYQNNNNRKIPRCQSLLLNVQHLDGKYPDWREWLSELKRLPNVGGEGRYDESHKQWRSKLERLVSEVGEMEKSLRQLKSNNHNPYFQESEALIGSKKVRFGKRALKELDARLLQFILDRTKVKDPWNLKEIYQCTRKLHKSQEQDEKSSDTEKARRVAEIKAKLVKAFEDGRLPEKMKEGWNPQDPSKSFPSSSFLHFIYAYYRKRERAEEGRLFIHPIYRDNPGRGYEKTGRFHDRAQLLTYCNHKPRQKRYQMAGDVAALLGVLPSELEKIVCDQVGNEAHQSSTAHAGDLLEGWLFKQRSMKGMKTACKDAANELKNRGGRNLSLDIQSVWKTAQYGDLISEGRLLVGGKMPKKPSQAIKNLLRQSSVPEPDKLLVLSGKAIEFCNELVCDLHDGRGDAASLFGPERAVFALAQINNIVLKDRGGFSRTCPVCSADNAFRSQVVQPDEEGREPRARSQRLPAIPNRVIDGAVRRMARIVSVAIADDKWKEIEKDIMTDKQVKVRIPIVIEANRFDFDQQLRNWIKHDTSKKKLSERNLFDEKQKRIRSAGYCPYTDEILGDDAVEDHIIPRASQWGTINDEANLVGATVRGNDNKGDSINYDLSNLQPLYRAEVFGKVNHHLDIRDDRAIENWIVNTLWDNETDTFKFGNYVSFSSLQPEERVAFRHALFLPSQHDLREKVIMAMNNRMRTLVNGTQRYFAETLAAAIYRKAMRVRRESQLSFDYYEVEAVTNARGRGIRDLRVLYAKNDSIIRDNTKQDGKKQEDYSHLIDAQLAFVIAADAHRNDGGMSIDIPDNILVAPTKDDGTDGILHYVRIPEEECKTRPMKRRKTSEDFFAHKTLFDSEPRAWHFLKLIEVTQGESSLYLQGFLDLHRLEKCLMEVEWLEALEKHYGSNIVDGDADSSFLPYARPIKGKNAHVIKELYSVEQFGYSRGEEKQPKTIFSEKEISDRVFTVKLHQIDHKKVAEFLLDKFNTGTDPESISDDDIKTYRMLWDMVYFTKRIKISEKTIIENTMAKLTEKFQFQKLYDPSLVREWRKVNDVTRRSDDDFGNQLNKHFLPNGNLAMHQAIRKHFSLPVKAEGQGFMLIRRHSWEGKPIYQLLSEKGGKDGGAGLYEQRIDKAGVYSSLRTHFRAKNIVLLRGWGEMKNVLASGGTPVNEDKWYPLPSSELKKANQTMEKEKEKLTENRVVILENKYISKGDSQYRVKFEQPIQDIGPLIGLMKAGLHIDEMQVGNREEAKDDIFRWLKDFFSNGGNNDQWMSIQEACDKLNMEIDNLNEFRKDKNRPPLTEEQIADLKRMKKWQEWISCIQHDKTLIEYKRGAGLKIDMSRPHANSNA